MNRTQMPQPSLPPPPEPPLAQPAKRRAPLIAVAIGVVAVLVAGVAAFVITHGDRAEAAPLALSFEQGQEQTYRLHQTMNAKISSDLTGAQPLATDVTETVSWKVVSVDPDGTATIEVSVSDVSGTVNGAEIPSSPVPPVQIVVASDGRVVSAGGIDLGALGHMGGAPGSGLPGMGQLTPILPDGPVTPGDTWKKTFSQGLPFGAGKIEYSASGIYERNETVNGREAAVITTDFTVVPLDLSIDLADVIQALSSELSGSAAAGAAGALGDAHITVGGRAAITQTSYVDLQDKELLRTNGRGRFDLTMSLSGIPDLGQAGPVDMNLAGTFTQELELR